VLRGLRHDLGESGNQVVQRAVLPVQCPRERAERRALEGAVKGGQQRQHQHHLRGERGEQTTIGQVRLSGVNSAHPACQ
jgi:hypothetical protein